MALVKCEDCGKDFSDAAKACPNCARPYHKPPMTREAGIGCARALVYFSLAAVGLLTLLVGACLFSINRTPAAISPEATPTASEPEAKGKDLWLQDRRGYDAARSFILRGMIRKSGSRCDSVDSMLMGEPGSWTVKCAPGYTYVFRFDAEGNPVGAMKVP